MSDALAVGNDDRLEAIAVEIETIQGVALLKVGERLLEAQELFKYQRDEQGFGGWVDSRLRFGQTTAYKLIGVFTAFGAESVHKVDTLPKSVLYALAEPSTPPSLRQKALDMVKPGKVVDDDALAALKLELAEAKKAAKDAKRDEKMQKEVAQKANDDRARMLRNYEWEKSRAESLAQEVERLKQEGVIHVYPSKSSTEDVAPVQTGFVEDVRPTNRGLSAAEIARIIYDNLHPETVERIAAGLDGIHGTDVAAELFALRNDEAA